MSNGNIRKTDSLGTSAAQLQSDFKEAHGKYNDLVSDLAFLTKSELKPIALSLEENNTINGMQEKAMDLFNKIENVLYDLDNIHANMDETVQTIGGMEFSTDNTVDKLSDILRYSENQQARMTKEITHLRSHFEREAKQDTGTLDELQQDIEEFQIEFSRFQDYLQESVPRVSKLFDQLDEEEARGKKYEKTHKI